MSKEIVQILLPEILFNEKELNEMGLLSNDTELIKKSIANAHIQTLIKSSTVINNTIVNTSNEWDILSRIYNVVKYQNGLVAAFIYEDWQPTTILKL